MSARELGVVFRAGSTARRETDLWRGCECAGVGWRLDISFPGGFDCATGNGYLGRVQIHGVGGSEAESKQRPVD